MINPYIGLDWNAAEYIKSMSHMHATNQERFEEAVKEGYRHIAVTNYQPSVPTYPLSDHFTNIPSHVIGCPNTEKVYTLNSSIHFCSLGSFAKGHGHTEGKTATWQQAFTEIIDQLQFPDGGGITINHPGYIGPETPEKLFEHLDFDPRVLGIEIYNSCGRKVDGLHQPCFYTDLWDAVLATGRRCWGFAVVDWRLPHKNNWGSNVLIVPTFTEQECLKAYRNGAFFMQIKDIGLRFTNISLTAGNLTVSVNNDCETKIITARGVVSTSVGRSAKYIISDNDVYVRIEATDITDPNAQIFSNPIML